MKKLATTRMSPFHVKCPFCDRWVDVLTELKWCGNCYIEWYKKRDGTIVFDDKRKTERFTLAKALCKSGGVKLCKK